MGFQKFKELEFVYEYDFAQDGGAISSISLRALGNALTSDLVVEEVQVLVETAFDGSATPTVTLGISGTTAGYLADFYSIASAANNTPIRNGEVAGSLLWDDTNDHEISYKIANTASAQPLMTIASQALTAGKAKFIFKCRRYV